MTRFTVTIQCFRTDGGIVVGGEDMDGLDDNVGHWLVKGGGGSEIGRGGHLGVGTWGRSFEA